MEGNIMMKRKNRLLSLLLCVAVALAFIPGAAFVVADNAETRDQGGGLTDFVAFAEDGDALALTVGEIVYFGKYPQSDLGKTHPSTGTSGVDWVAAAATDYFTNANLGTHYYKIEPIAWQVLENAGGELFLLARDGLDAEPYNVTYEQIRWEGCTLRAWLNNSTTGFLGKAFTAGEKSSINTKTLQNYEHPDYIAGGGSYPPGQKPTNAVEEEVETNDKVFLLSVPEALNTSYGFAADYAVNDNPYAEDETRVAWPTAYAKGQGAIYYDFEQWQGDEDLDPLLEKYDGSTIWWLRSPGTRDDYAAYVHDFGHVYSRGYGVDQGGFAVRPALKLDMASVALGSITGKLTVIPKSEVPIPTITTPALAGGKVGEAYSQMLTATSVTPVTWSVTSGSLPDGLTLDASMGAISGTPTTANTYTFTIQASNGFAAPATKQFSIVIAASQGGDVIKETIKQPVDDVAADSSPSVTAIRTPLKTLYMKKGTTVTPPVCADSVNPVTKKASTTAKLTWASGKPKIATVNASTGRIEAKKAGTAKITATASNGKKLTITVKVVAKAEKLKKVAFTKPPASLKVGKTAILKLKVTPAKATNLNVKFSSSDKKILTVDKAGKLTALKKGKATITVKIGKKTYVKAITVK
jgi:uncharacterized protein YjdB